jgi:hypothetical protein
VSLTVVFRETAVRNLARIRGEDKDVFARTRRAIAMLTDQPYPEGAVAWGATGICRLHAGDIRIRALQVVVRPLDWNRGGCSDQQQRFAVIGLVGR